MTLPFFTITAPTMGFGLVLPRDHAQVLADLARSMGLVSANGLPLASNTFTNQDLQLVSKVILDACDGLDGLVDGMVNDFHGCTTEVVTPRLEALECSGGKTPACLLRGQIDAIEKIYAGPPTRGPDGKPTYYGWSWDPGIAGCTSAVDCNTPTATNIAAGWRAWKIGQFQANLATATNNALDFTGGAGGANCSVLAPTPPYLPAPTANEGLYDLLVHFDPNPWTLTTWPALSQDATGTLVQAAALGPFDPPRARAHVEVMPTVT